MNEAGTRPPPALVLDADLRQSLVCVRALGRAGMTVYAAEGHPGSPTFRSRWCSGSFVLGDVARDRDAFITRLIEVCAALGRPVVISSHDGTIEAMRARRGELEAVARLALAGEAALQATVDKRHTLAIAERVGVPIPPGRTVRSMAQAEEAIDAVGLPLVVKPAISWVGSGSVGWRAAPFLARSGPEARDRIAMLVDGGTDALVQPWLSGAREAVNLFVADDRVWALFTSRAARMSPLIGGSSVMRESIPNPQDIASMATALVREIGFAGYAEIEFRRDRHGRPFLMEINPRLSAAVEIAGRAGVNFPLMLYRWAARLPLEPADGYRYGRRMRWLKGDVEWLKEAIRNPGHPDAPAPASATWRFVSEFARPTGYDYWDRGDPRPALVVGARMLRSLPVRVGRKLRPAGKPGREAP